MREIKFRGKRLEYGEWVYGYLIGDDVIVGNIVEFNDEYFNTSFWWEVRPETVGQDTGLKDKNGKEIFEGDIVKGTLSKGFNYLPNIGIVKYGWMAYVVETSIQEYLFAYFEHGSYEVIGNIHSNPELLEVKNVQ